MKRSNNNLVNPPRLIIAGTFSGVGKTTVATGIMAALIARNLKVQPFKVGPDYIDPTYHKLATGLNSRNLDSWMLSHKAIPELFLRAAHKADISVIEGVMGLYDGHSGLDDSGSTAEVAKLLNAPTILIIDASKMARSAGAVALGYTKYDPDLNFAGFIVNKIGSERHYGWVKEAIEQATSTPVLGYLPADNDFEMPERHLGLVPMVEKAGTQFIEPLRRQIEQTLHLDRMLALSRDTDSIETRHNEFTVFPTEPFPPAVDIAYACDDAFSFYYQENLELLEAYGARIVPFSPLRDDALPPNTQGIYIGGGFPEVYAERLCQNQAILESIRRATGRGIPVYGECGGIMYLSEGITDFNGNQYRMAGLVPGWSQMRDRIVRMGYVEVEFQRDTILATRGTRLRGHEFHWSERDIKPVSPAYRFIYPEERNEGYAEGNLLASYVHLHFGTDPNLACNFVAACRHWASL